MKKITDFSEGTLTIPVAEYNEQIARLEAEKIVAENAIQDWARRLKAHEEALRQKSEGLPIIELRHKDPLAYRPGPSEWLPENEAAERFIERNSTIEEGKLHKAVNNAQWGLTRFNAYRRLKNL